jgi:hypothetical protein
VTDGENAAGFARIMIRDNFFCAKLQNNFEPALYLCTAYILCQQHRRRLQQRP